MKNTLSRQQLWELWWIIVHARNAMNKARRKETSELDIEEQQAAALVVMRSIGHRATPAEIARWLVKEPHSVSTLIKRMEKNGLVKKVRDLEKKNLVRVAMTQKGEQKYDLVVRRKSIYEIMSVLSNEEYHVLRGAMDKLWRKALEEMGANVFKPPIPSNGLDDGIPEEDTATVS
jgi:DNA-binding MarR family transcriptional regulator